MLSLDGVKSAAEKLVDLKRYVIMGTLLAIDGNSWKNIQTKLDWGAGRKARLHPGHFWYGLSVPVENFFAIFQVFWQYFKFFAIFQVFWQHFKIDSCMSINLVPCSINIKCISWYKHTYSMHKWHQIQIHRNSKHSTEWWTCSFFFNQRNSLVAFLFISIVKTTI